MSKHWKDVKAAIEKDIRFIKVIDLKRYITEITKHKGCLQDKVFIYIEPIANRVDLINKIRNFLSCV